MVENPPFYTFDISLGGIESRNKLTDRLQERVRYIKLCQVLFFAVEYFAAVTRTLGSPEVFLGRSTRASLLSYLLDFTSFNVKPFEGSA